MGEITDALRRAKLERQVRRDAESEPEPAAPFAETTVARAGLDLPPPLSRPVPSPAPTAISELTSWRDEADDDADFVEIARERTGPWPARAVLLDPREPHTEHIRRFAVRVRQELRHRGMKSVLLTSAARGEGKTFSACNLALALASMAAGDRIALLELDTRRPSAADGFGVVPRVGIEDVLLGATDLGAARVRTEFPALDLYLVRKAPAQAHEILTGPSLEALFRELGARYDVIVVDSPPVLLVSDVSLIVGHVDACVAVVRAGSSRLKAAREMFEQLPRDKLLGAFVNDVSKPRRSGQYEYYSAQDEPQ